MILRNAASFLFLFLVCAQARDIVMSGCRLSSNVVWGWKFSFDPVHTKLTAKKPTLILDHPVRLQNGKYIKLAAASS